MDIKKNASNKDTWLRGLFILVFGIIFYVLYILIWLLVTFQFVTKVITGELNSNLEQFAIKMTSYAMQILNYITYQSDERPFPFSQLPNDGTGTPTPLKVESEEETMRKKPEKNTGKDEED